MVRVYSGVCVRDDDDEQDCNDATLRLACNMRVHMHEMIAFVLIFIVLRTDIKNYGIFCLQYTIRKPFVKISKYIYIF